MKTSTLNNAGLLILSIVFSTALIFAFIELPRLFDQVLQTRMGFPQFDHGLNDMNALKTELFIQGLHLRLIGYLSLILIVLLIVLGYTTRKSSWAMAGAIGLFIPVFGQFAFSMFFLAGLGILRVVWLPFLDISFDILDLGKAIFIPYWILMWFFGLFKWNAHQFLCWFFMASGALLFTWGVLLWFRSRYRGKQVATSWIYRISRHPQYLGWILWSYGFILFSPHEQSMKMTWSVPSSLPWLLMTMTIVGICMLEELKMMERTGGSYAQYRSRSPFLFPLPSWLKKILKAPARLVTREDHPETRGQVFLVTLIYTVLIILLSLFWVDLGLRQTENPSQEKTLTELSALSGEIRAMGDKRRELWPLISQLPGYGEQGMDSLLVLATHPNPIVREFSMQMLGQNKVQEGEDIYLAHMTDSIWRVRAAAIDAATAIQSKRSVDTLIRILEDPALNRNAFLLYGALGSTGNPRAVPYLVKGLEGGPWHEQISALNALVQIDEKQGLAGALSELEDPDVEVRRHAVMTCILLGDPAAREGLESVLDDADFEVRFYARQGLKKLEKDAEKMTIL